MKVFGVTTLKAFRQSNPRLSQTAEPDQGQARGLVEPSRPDFTFLVQCQLFAQKKILGSSVLDRKPTVKNVNKSLSSFSPQSHDSMIYQVRRRNRA